jgi:hypothetical protein
MEDLFIVIYRLKAPKGVWQSQAQGVFEGSEAQRLAHNYAECLNAQYPAHEHAVVHGPIVSPVEMAAAEATVQDNW